MTTSSRYNLRSKSKKQKVHFFDLPFEIRSQIYDNAFDAACIVYSIHTSTPQVRHCQQSWRSRRDLPTSDEGFDTPLLVSKRFHREVKPMLFSKSRIILVADVDYQEISPDIDLSNLAPNVKYLEMSSRILGQKQSWSLFPNLKQITITHDVAFDIVMNLWDSWDGQPEGKIRAGIKGNLERTVLSPDFLSRLPDRCQSPTKAPDIVLRGEFLANRSTHDPRENFTFLTVYQNNYTYDFDRKRLKILTPKVVSERTV